MQTILGLTLAWLICAIMIKKVFFNEINIWEKLKKLLLKK